MAYDMGRGRDSNHPVAVWVLAKIKSEVQRHAEFISASYQSSILDRS